MKEMFIDSSVDWNKSRVDSCTTLDIFSSYNKYLL